MTPAEERAARSVVEDVRRFGLVSADAVVDRYVRLVDRAMGGPAPPPPGARRGSDDPRDPGADALAGGAAALVGAWLRVLEATASLADRASGTAASLGTLELPATGPGLAAEGALWVHNTTDAPTAVDLVATSLAGPGGRAVPADAVSLTPASMAALAARTSAEVRVRVLLPDGQAPGRYQGLVLTSAAEQPVLLRLEVRAAGGGGR